MLYRRYSQARKDREVEIDTEEISNAVLPDIIAAILKRVRKLDRSHDIPYMAGYSVDGGTIYIDRHLPRSFLHDRKHIETDRFLIVHEVIEKSLLDELGLHYVHAHQIAVRTEQAAVRATGVRWRDYDRFMKSNMKRVGDERILKVPSDLDLRPYRDEHDAEVLREIMKRKSK
jgi:hypothetical protein